MALGKYFKSNRKSKKVLKNLNGLTLNEIMKRIKSNLSLYMLIGGQVNAKRLLR